MELFNNHSTEKKVLTVILLTFFLVGTATIVTAGKSSREGYLGVSIERLSRDKKKELGVSHGVVVTRVVEDSPADKAGILEDDIIQYFDGKKIRNPDDLVRVVRQKKPETEVKVTFIRDEERKDVTVQVGKLQSNFYGYRWRDEDDFFILSQGGGYLGVQLQDLNTDLAGYFGVKEDEGALILKVEEDTPAEEAGMKSGDVIVQIDEEEVGNAADVREILSDFEEGDEVVITVIRHNRRQRFKVELDERPHSSSIRIFRDPDRWDFRRNLKFHLNLPHFDHFEFVPEFDWDVRFDKNIRERLDEDVEEQLERKLETIQDKIRRKLDKVEKRLHRIREAIYI